MPLSLILEDKKHFNICPFCIWGIWLRHLRVSKSCWVEMHILEQNFQPIPIPFNNYVKSLNPNPAQQLHMLFHLTCIIDLTYLHYLNSSHKLVRPAMTKSAIYKTDIIDMLIWRWQITHLTLLLIKSLQVCHANTLNMNLTVSGFPVVDRLATPKYLTFKQLLIPHKPSKSKYLLKIDVRRLPLLAPAIRARRWW